MASADRDALLALYRSTDGPNWKRKDNWGTDAALSKWSGVTVNDEGRMVKLFLWNNNLRGIYGLPCGHRVSLFCGVFGIWPSLRIR